MPDRAAAGARSSPWYAAAAFALAAIFSASIGFSLMRMPVQVSDSLDEILAVQKLPSAWAAFTATLFGDHAHVRPLRTAQTRILLDLSSGRYRLTYRGFHAALVLACFLLFVRALRVRTATDLAAASLALTVLMGVHTFRGGLQEAYPVNHFLEAAVLCLLTLNLAQARPAPWADVAAAAVFVVAALTLESGLLVWVVAVAARLAGYRGISGRGVVALTCLLAGYFVMRYAYLDVATPALGERATGYWLGVLEPDQQVRRFASQPFLFHGYNVAASILSVLFGEPQGGIFVALNSWLKNDVPPRAWLSVVSATTTTVLIARSAWRSTRAGSDLAVLFVCAAVIGANAVFCYAYIKDEIMLTAGVFYAIAAFIGVRSALAEMASLRRPAAVALVAVLALVASTWAVRSIGLHQVMRAQAFKQRSDWAFLPVTWKGSDRWPSDPAGLRLLTDLRTDAMRVSAPNPRFEPRWAYRWWGE